MAVLLSALMLGLPLAAADEAGWVSLFDGQSLAGWRASEHPESFRVQDGALVAGGPRAHLYYVGADGHASFRNFEFEAEVMSRPGANSGIFFHTAFQDTGFPAKGFEAQIDATQPEHGGYLERKKTGSLYCLRNLYKSPVPDNEWFKLAIAVRGRRIQIRINGALLVDFTEAQPPVLDPQRPGRSLSSGTFALQCHDPESVCLFRRLRVKPLPDDLAEPTPPVVVDDLYREVIRLGTANFPLVDFHTHLKGGLTLEEVLAHMRATGINHGIATNGGIGFPLTDDAGVEAFRQSMHGAPCYIGLQAEGREWPKLFSRGAIAKFDYIFTDAMTIVDHRGRRARLWIPEEVDIPDKQAFMELLVTTIEQILDHEPVDIYANPTYLPDVLAPEYDELWTPARMDRVVAAAQRNGVAIEIASRLKIPHLAFLQRAKAAGIKFTLGTNNVDKELGHLEYALAMVKELGLTWKDMWMPKPDGQKPVQVRPATPPAPIDPANLDATLLADSPVTFPAQGALPAKYPPDQPAKDGLTPEEGYFLFSTPERSLAQIKAIQAEMPPGSFLPVPPDWTHLPRAHKLLTEGGDLHILGLGDSIVNDTMRSGWLALLQEAYPRAKVRGTVYVRGGGGCQHYREADRIAKWVVPRRPDVVLIGGISQQDIASIRVVMGQLRAALPQVEILLTTGTFGAVDPRDPAVLALAHHSGTGEWGRELRALADEQQCAFLDMTTPWGQYVRSAGGHPHRFYRDRVHANEYGEQILAKILLAFWG